MSTDAVVLAIEAALGSRVERWRRVSGGDINQAHQAELADGRTVFVKSNESAPAGMFAAEARGLAWLCEARALRIPRVWAEGPDFLVLESIDVGEPCLDHDEELGRGLASLHAFGAPGFGLDHDNFIGRLDQKNAPMPTWAEFYRARRLQPQLRLAVERGLLSPRTRRGVEHILSRLEDLVGPTEPPARLHGDLWGGNAIVDERGMPCLIDPAVYGGHREIDLAMMKLFGGFRARVFAAYEEAFPLADGYRSRVPLYQLYFLMVHVNLFGEAYVQQVEHALAAIG